jgi:hypothetical protein
MSPARWEEQQVERQESIEEAKKLWAAGKMFYIQATVSSPYDGCMFEPNIFLVIPPEHEDYDEDTDAVLPLYASGQGLGVDYLRTLDDICTWIEQGSLDDAYEMHSDHNSRTDGPHGKIWGGFDSFVVLNASLPINELPANEHYWVAALKIAQEEWEQQLQWHCDMCNNVYEYDEYECVPHRTGYKGNGGIGVFMEGGICDECFREGVCVACDYSGMADHEMYDPQVVANSLHLCEWHTAKLFDGCVTAAEDLALEFPDVVEIGYVPVDSTQVHFNFDDVPRRKFCIYIDDKPVTSIELDEEILEEHMQELDVLDLMWTDPPTYTVLDNGGFIMKDDTDSQPTIRVTGRELENELEV